MPDEPREIQIGKMSMDLHPQPPGYGLWDDAPEDDTPTDLKPNSDPLETP